jgi:hypothetical protein
VKTTPTPTPTAASTSASARSRLPGVDLVLTLGLLAVFAVAFLTATEWSVKAGLFPRLVTGLGVVLAVLHVVLLLLRSRTAGVAPVTESVEADDEADLDVEYVFAHAGGRAWAAALAWIASFFIGLYVVGLFVAAPLFALIYLRFSARRSWLFSAVYAVVTGVVLYLAFEVALRLQVPPGLFV